VEILIWTAAIGAVITVLLAGLVLFTVLRPGRQEAAVKEAMENTGKRITELHGIFVAEIGRVREENKEAVMKMSVDMQEKIYKSLSDGRMETKIVLETVAKGLEERFAALQQSNEQKLEQIRENVETKLTRSIERSSEDFQKIAETFTKVHESVNTFVEIGKDINNLSDILASPKLRGNFGEFTLEELIAQILPVSNYRMQCEISKGLIVDAAIKMKGEYLCIDSKFPLESYKRAIAENASLHEKEQAMKDFYMDVKKHITGIKNKYIIPEKTLDFAFMFIPAEAVYYEIIKDTRLSKYSFDSRVVPVSPNTFFAYLNIIALGFKGMKIEEEAKSILKALHSLSSKVDKVKEKFDVLGGHLDKARGAYGETYKRIQDVKENFDRIDSKEEKELIE